MKKCALRLVAALALAGFAPHSFGRDVFVHGFEKYAPGSSISGQAIGSTTWSVAGFVAGDETTISQTDSAADGNSLLIGDNNTANRPRVTVNLVSGGFAAAALQKGTITFWMREDPSDAGAADRYKHTFGSISLQYGGGTSLNFSVVGGTSINPTLTASGYLSAHWNEIQVQFDNSVKSAWLFVNGNLAGIITGATADFSVTSLTFGGYATTTTGDRIYVDAVRASIPNTFSNGFEDYADASAIWLQALNPENPAGNWTMQGLITTGTPDEAHVTDDVFFSGAQSLAIADNNTNNPRIYANFVTAGIIPVAAQAGSVEVWVKEDDNDGANRDGYTLMVGGTTVYCDRNDKITFSLTGSADILPVPLKSNSFEYDQTDWNQLRVDFDNVAQTATLYINGGYGATLTAPIGGATNFTVGSVRLAGANTSWTGDKAWYDDLSADFAGPAPTFEWRSSLYPSDWQPGYADEKGRFLHDFSYAGYRRGEVPVPNIAGPVYDVTAYPYRADKTGALESTAAIQSAINAAGAAGGGVVYLPAGTYKVNPGTNKYALHLNGNNVVLRGDGVNQTYILNTDATMHDTAVIRVSGPATSELNWYSGTFSTPVTADIPLPTTVIPVASTTGYNVGDMIILRGENTDQFLKDILMDVYWAEDDGLTYPGRTLSFCRRVVAKTATTLTVDVPTRFPMLLDYNCTVLKPSGTLVKEIGIEDISIGMLEISGTLAEDEWDDEDKPSYNAHNSYAIYVSGAENCWIKRVNSFKPTSNATFHLLSNGIKLDKSRLITVDSCDLRLSQYKGAGGNGYLYYLTCQECLFQDCRAEAGRHNLSINMMYCSGNVLLRTYLKNSMKDSDFHQFLSMANLLDSTTCEGEMLESRLRTEVNSPVPGWTSVESVFWNTKGLSYADHSTDGSPGLRVINSYQLNQRGYVIGTTGPAYAVRSTDFVEGVGKSDKLIPQSLYLDQRMKRLGY